MGRWLSLLVSVALVCTAPHAARADEEPEAPAAHAEREQHGAEQEEAEGEFNWAYGFIGEKEGVEPSLMYRPKGMPPPFLANIINAAVLFTIIVVAGKKPIALGLRRRKERIVQGMEEAGRMKEEAAKRLAEYEEKLEHIDREVERVRTEMRQSAETERRRLLTEAKERRERMERDARLLVEQETKAARETLARETVAAAVKSAEDIIARSLAPADHERIGVEYLDALRRAQLGAAGGAS
jgi:F-type H+-transporting ATPase subunit b